MQILYFLLSVILLCACTPEKNLIEPVSSDTYFQISIDDSNLQLQIALTDNERKRGLMYREELPENHGMLFLFEHPGKRSFWMRNTKIPLDLAYFDSQGTLVEIHPDTSIEEIESKIQNDGVLIAVEMNQGWFSYKNIQPGAKLDLKALNSAIISRGYSPSIYSIKSIQ